MIVLFLLYRAFYSARDDARYYIFQGIWEETAEAEVVGQVDYLQLRQGQDRTVSTSIYLKKCKIYLKKEHKNFYLKRLLVYCDNQVDLEPGNQIHIQGEIKEFTVSSNPGQFDQKSYYKEKGIYYQFQSERYQIIDSRYSVWQKTLYGIRDKMAEVYQAALPEKEGGIITAMILGDKSLLDMDIKKLYQENGIGHLLAISGLHITILGMALYRLLQRMGIPAKGCVLFGILVLFCYGRMTDFSISTSRAVIMMILFLAAQWIGRTYDMKSALAFSGIWILLQKPFALFSCSFLLSFGAMTGIGIILPVLCRLVYGGEEKQRERKRRRHRWEKEIMANYRFGKVAVSGCRLRDHIISMLLTSISVQLMTLPVLLYFFFEIPLYGIVINLFVIPLASFVVLLAFAGGSMGCLCLPLGKLLLGSVYYLLRFYEKICRFFQHLPGQIQILGRPSVWEIILYYIGLSGLLVIIWWRAEQKGEVSYRFLAGFFVLGLLFYPVRQTGFQMTFLDVGQGDGIVIRSASGEIILLDGGSSSVSGVGTYRIFPFLKYSGIRRVNHMIMTHSDEDHISGLMEILKESGESGLRVENLVVPDIQNRETGFFQIVKLAREKGVSVTSLSEGYVLRCGELSLTCLNPEQGALVESANAGSLTLSMRYGGFSCLLTGDLEGEGEQHVKQLLKDSRKKYLLPDAYTMLKVAHHGSKNSTSEEFLQMVTPQLALISCGKKNWYGHPHEELIKRLEAENSKIFRTDQSGAVSVRIKKDRLSIREYSRKNSK